MASHLRRSFFSYRLAAILLLGAILAGCTVPGAIPNSSKAGIGAVSDPRQAQVKSQRGTVEIETGSSWSALSAGAQPAALTAGQRIRTGDLSSAQIGFSDGSLVSLGANSELSIDELDAGSQGSPRVIVLTQVSGESQHTVAHSSLAGSRYEVRTPQGAASAKGTQFSVRVLPGQTSNLSVTEGAVLVQSAGAELTLNAGQMTTLALNHNPTPPLSFLSGEGPVTQIGATWTIAGLDFKTTPATLTIGAVKTGDIVHFEGHLLADGSRVLDVVVLLQPALSDHFRIQGTVEKITATAWTVSGLTIQLTPQTQIEPDIAQGDLVWVEGSVLPNGVFQAERIGKESQEGGSPFEFTSPVQEIGADHWTIASLPIKVDAQTEIEKGIEKGSLVLVTGIIQKDGSWLASSIELAKEEEHPFEFTGVIESISPWKVAGIAVETRPWTQVDPGLKVGDPVRVEGTIQADGVWVAAEIRRVTLGETRLVIIGPVISINPWVVNGVPFVLSPQTVIVGNITVGILVRVEARRLDNGDWEAVRIEPLQGFVWVPTCLDLRVVVISLSDTAVQFKGWPEIPLTQGVKLSGQFAPDTPATVRICFSSTLIVQIISITVITVEPAPPDESNSDRVLICHKPGKKGGGKTMLLPRSALAGHLGHGDTLGACR